MRSKLTILLAAALLISAATIPAFAADYTGYISIDSVQAHAGDPFSVAIRLHNNNAPFSGLLVPIRYDSPYLTLDSVTFDGSIVIDGLSGGSFDFQTEKRVNIMYLPVPSSEPPPTISGPTGLVATVYFTLSDQAPAQFIDLDSVFIDS
ncbi:MAG: cohesin domain-containing protein, partial [Candidatus Zixiibacteriota bacterium]